MTNNIKKLAVAELACVALVGTTFAAPHGGHGGRHAPAPAPTHHRAPEPHPAPPPPAQHHTAGITAATMRMASRRLGGSSIGDFSSMTSLSLSSGNRAPHRADA